MKKAHTSSYRDKGAPHKYSTEYQNWALATRENNQREIARWARAHSEKFAPLSLTPSAARALHFSSFAAQDRFHYGP